MRLVFKTNLDEPQREVGELNAQTRAWFGSAPPVPRVGERILFWFDKHEAGVVRRACFELEVVAVSHDFGAREIHIELHIPRWMQTNVGDWSRFYRRPGRGDLREP